MSSLPHMPLWVDAYLADTSHLTFEEHGVYINLLLLTWRSPDCRMPNDMDWIKRRLRASDDDMKVVESIIAEFFSSTGNWLHQKRLTKECNFVSQQRKKQSDRAKSRWEKEKGLSRGNATSCNAPTPTPTPIINILIKSFDLFWNSCPRKVGKKKAKAEYERIVKKGEATEEQLIEGMKNYAEMVKGKDQSYVVHPLTWLNQGRWDDEVQQPQKMGQGRVWG